MDTVIFKIEKWKSESIANLLKEINEISCRLYIDFEKGVVTAKDVNNDVIDTIIEVIDKHFIIESISVDNTTNQEKSELNENDRVAKFSDKDIENLLNEKLIKTIVWAMSHGMSSEEIQKYIWTMITEISYSNSSSSELRVKNVSVGDVVQVNFGKHPIGEMSDSRGYAIVCNISTDGSLFLVPIDKESSNIDSNSFNILENSDVTVLLEMSKYVNPRRLDKVLGKVEPEFLKELLNQIAITFDFNSNAEEIDFTKCLTAEMALQEIIGPALEKVMPGLYPEDNQIFKFLADIGMPNNVITLRKAFEVGIHLEKITYNNLISQIISENPEMYDESDSKNLRNLLKRIFDNWAQNYPDLKKQCSKISIVSIIKMFAKKFNNS